MGDPTRTTGARVDCFSFCWSLCFLGDGKRFSRWFNWSAMTMGPLGDAENSFLLTGVWEEDTPKRFFLLGFRGFYVVEMSGVGSAPTPGEFTCNPPKRIFWDCFSCSTLPGNPEVGSGPLGGCFTCNPPKRFPPAWFTYRLVPPAYLALVSERRTGFSCLSALVPEGEPLAGARGKVHAGCACLFTSAWPRVPGSMSQFVGRLLISFGVRPLKGVRRK